MAKSEDNEKKTSAREKKRRVPRLTREEIAEALGKVMAENKNRIHVISWDGFWGVIRKGAKRMSKARMDKESAIDFAKRIAKKRGVSVVIHREDGRPEEYIHP